jgi:hypothetical protein
VAASRVIYTAITNGHAELSPHPEVPDTDFICFSDVALDRGDWQVRPIDASVKKLSPRMQAKFHKVFPPREYDWSIWLDGSYRLRTHMEAAHWLRYSLVAGSPSGFGLYRHPARNCLYDETAHSMALRKCSEIRSLLEAQARSYAEQGHPKASGLWLGGALCRKKDPGIDRIMERWWDEITRWTWRDQISLAFVLHEAGFRPDAWDWSFERNPFTERWAWSESV